MRHGQMFVHGNTSVHVYSCSNGIFILPQREENHQKNRGETGGEEHQRGVEHGEGTIASAGEQLPSWQEAEVKYLLQL